MTNDQRPIVRVDRVSKVFCASFELARVYGIRDIFSRRRRDLEHLRRGEFLALRSVSLSVRPGEHVLVLGTRSSGKTTLAKLMSGVLRPDAGRIELAGRAAMVAGGKLGMNPFMSVWEYLQLATALRGVSPDRADETCREILETTQLTDSRKTRLIDLSEIAVKYLSLATSLAVERDLYVFDGMLSSGGDPVADRLNTRLQDILARETTIVLTSNTRKLPPHVDRVLILHAGEILYEGSVETAVAIYQKFERVLQRREDPAAWSPRRIAAAVPEAGATDAPASAAEVVLGIARNLDDSLFVAAMDDDLQRAWSDGRPVVVGPYFSEVGFELLYWIPFLAWARERFGRAGQPVVALSRGRVGDWYRSVADQYVDVGDLMPAAQFRQHHRTLTADLGSATQGTESPFERELVRAVAGRLGLGEPGLVHPSGLVRLCSRVSHGKLPIDAITERARYRRLEPQAAREPLSGLPSTYVAASFWFGTGFPNTPEHRAAVGTLVAAASRRMPVVLLDTKGVPEDERRTWDGGAGVTLFDTYTYGEYRLPTQSQVIAGARGFLGTFGGRSWLAPLHGVPSVAVHGERSGQSSLYAAVAERALGGIGSPMIVRRVETITAETAADLIDQILPRGAE